MATRPHPTGFCFVCAQDLILFGKRADAIYCSARCRSVAASRRDAALLRLARDLGLDERIK